MLSRYRSPVAVRSPLVRSSVEDCDVIGSGLRRAFFSGYNSHLRALSRSAMLGVVWAVRDVSSTVSWLSEALEATLFDGCYGGRDRRVRSKLRFASTKSRNAFCDLNAFRRLRILLICGLPFFLVANPGKFLLNQSRCRHADHLIGARRGRDCGAAPRTVRYAMGASETGASSFGLDVVWEPFTVVPAPSGARDFLSYPWSASHRRRQ
jgi:hypothetical protein